MAVLVRRKAPATASSQAKQHSLNQEPATNTNSNRMGPSLYDDMKDQQDDEERNINFNSPHQLATRGHSKEPALPVPAMISIRFSPRASSGEGLSRSNSFDGDSLDNSSISSKTSRFTLRSKSELSPMEITNLDTLHANERNQHSPRSYGPYTAVTNESTTKDSYHGRHSERSEEDDKQSRNSLSRTSASKRSPVLARPRALSNLGRTSTAETFKHQNFGAGSVRGLPYRPSFSPTGGAPKEVPKETGFGAGNTKNVNTHTIPLRRAVTGEPGQEKIAHVEDEAPKLPLGSRVVSQGDNSRIQAGSTNAPPQDRPTAPSTSTTPMKDNRSTPHDDDNQKAFAKAIEKSHDRSASKGNEDPSNLNSAMDVDLPKANRRSSNASGINLSRTNTLDTINIEDAFGNSKSDTWSVGSFMTEPPGGVGVGDADAILEINDDNLNWSTLQKAVLQRHDSSDIADSNFLDSLLADDSS